MVSLAFLHHAARRAGIDPDPFFREVAALARPETEGVMRGFLEWDEADIEQLVETFSWFTGTGLRARSRSSAGGQTRLTPEPSRPRIFSIARPHI